MLGMFFSEHKIKSPKSICRIVGSRGRAL